MKKIILYLFLSMVITFSAEAHKSKKTQITISIQTFYDQLSPYGDWIYSPDYGYVWRPYFDHPESFRPYSSNGNWVYTDYGWTWTSGYQWGWATFHYGRWDFDNYLGWLWIPGYEWAPAWVSWGTYDNYWGWAPLGPNIYVNTNWYAPDPWWTFVERDHFYTGNWNRYIYNRPVNVTHITHITNVYVDNDNRNNHNSWYYGPRVSDVERYGKSRVTKMEIVDDHRSEGTVIRNNKLNIYRPTVDNSRKDSRPTEYRNVEQVRTGTRIEQSNARTNDPGTNRTRQIQSGTQSNRQMSTQKSETSTRQVKVEPRNIAQESTNRISTRQLAEPKRETAARESRYNRASNAQPIREQRTKEVTPSSNSRIQNIETQKNIKEDVRKAVSESRKQIKNSETKSTKDNKRR